jgi:hypothetical protein
MSWRRHEAALALEIPRRKKRGVSVASNKGEHGPCEGAMKKSPPELAMNRSPFAAAALSLVLALSACSSNAPPGDASVTGGTSQGGSAGIGAMAADAQVAGASSADAPAGEVPIIAGAGVDVPYALGPNPYGIQGGAFFARSVMGTTSVALDKTQPGKICMSGTVEIVPTPEDGSHPPYSTYWGIDLGFNLNQSETADPAVKTPWIVPAEVIGFWFTVEGPTIPFIRFKTTPTGKDPALEQDSCAVVAAPSGVPNQVLFKDMFVQCWNGPPGTGPTDISMGLVDIGLQVAAGTDAALPLDFCLTALGVITE